MLACWLGTTWAAPPQQPSPYTPVYSGNWVQTPQGIQNLGLNGLSEDVNNDGIVDSLTFLPTGVDQYGNRASGTPNYNQGSQPNYNQGFPPNYIQGSTPNYNQGIPPNYNQGSQSNYNQGLQPNYNQGSQQNYNQGFPPTFNQGLNTNNNQGSNPNYNSQYYQNLANTAYATAAQAFAAFGRNPNNQAASAIQQAGQPNPSNILFNEFGIPALEAPTTNPQFGGPPQIANTNYPANQFQSNVPSTSVYNPGYYTSPNGRPTLNGYQTGIIYPLNSYPAANGYQPANVYPTANNYPGLNSYLNVNGYPTATNYPGAPGYPTPNNNPAAPGYTTVNGYPTANGYPTVNGFQISTASGNPNFQNFSTASGRTTDNQASKTTRAPTFYLPPNDSNAYEAVPRQGPTSGQGYYTPSTFPATNRPNYQAQPISPYQAPYSPFQFPTSNQSPAGVYNPTVGASQSAGCVNYLGKLVPCNV